MAVLIALTLGPTGVRADRFDTGRWLGRDSELSPIPPTKPAPTPSSGAGDRTGGDTFATATPIAAIPYTDEGSTCGLTNDWDEVCPYSGSTAPDVIYRFDCPTTIEVSVDLCASSYDTKLSIHDGAFGAAIACNDDAGCGYSGWQSRLERVALQAGHSYYFVVDGYSGCGNYLLSVDRYVPCSVVCSGASTPEDEPPCADGYVDEFNSGCTAGRWLAADADSEACAVVCGRSCTYATGGLSFRDSDWYRCFAVGGPVTADAHGEFALSIFLIYGVDCSSLAYVRGDVPRCSSATVSWTCVEGQEVWVWIGPQTYWGVPESTYLLRVCGLRAPVPVVPTSWGRLKARLW